MATRRSNTATARTSPHSAGKPATPARSRARSAKANASPMPSPQELDLRDRLKSGPRRPAGPPLSGDHLSRSAMDAMANEVVPEQTNPRNRRGRK